MENLVVIPPNSFQNKINYKEMEEVFMTQEEFENSIEVGDVIETDKGEKLRCVSKENGEPHFKLIESELESETKFDKQLRKDLDALLQKLQEADKSRERSIAITKLQEAIMWLGMDLKRLGTPNPYPESKNPESPVVHPTADGLKM